MLPIPQIEVELTVPEKVAWYAPPHGGPFPGVIPSTLFSDACSLMELVRQWRSQSGIKPYTYPINLLTLRCRPDQVGSIVVLYDDFCAAMNVYDTLILTLDYDQDAWYHGPGWEGADVQDT